MRYGALYEEGSRRFQTDRQLSAVRSAAKALAGKAAAKIPPARAAELQAVILAHFKEQQGSSQLSCWPASRAEQQLLLEAALAVDPITLTEGWQSHAAQAVRGLVAAADRAQAQL